MQAGRPTLPLHNGTNFRVDQPYLYKMEYTSDWASTISFSNGQFISAFNIVTGLVLMYTQVLSTYLHGSHLHTHRTHQIHYVIALSAQCSVVGQHQALQRYLGLKWSNYRVCRLLFLLEKGKLCAVNRYNYIAVVLCHRPEPQNELFHLHQCQSPKATMYESM